MDYRGRRLCRIQEDTAIDHKSEASQYLYGDATSHEDFVECVLKSISFSEETVGDPDLLLDCSKDSNEFQLQQSDQEAPRRSSDTLIFSPREQLNSVKESKILSGEPRQKNSARESEIPSAEQQNSYNDSEFRYKFSPTSDGFSFFSERKERNIDIEENPLSIHLTESITMAVDQTTRHCRSVYSALLGHGGADESDEPITSMDFKNKLRTKCSKQLHTISNVSRQLLSCPVVGNREAQSEGLPDAPPSQKMWKMCKESKFELQHRYKEFERSIRKTAAKTKRRIEKRRRAEGSLNGFQSSPNSFACRQAAAQRLRELIQQKHSLNMSDRNCFNEDEHNESTGECNVFEPSMSWQETLDWDKVLHDLSMPEHNDATLSARTYVSAGATTSSPDQSTSTGSIEKLSVLLDQYLDQQTNSTTDPPSPPSNKTDCKSSSSSSAEKLGALLGEYFDKQKSRFVVPTVERKTECKIIIEDSAFHAQVKKGTESLSYSSGLTECSSEDSSIDCSAIVEHENNVTEQFGAYQAEFDLYRELEASMMMRRIV